MAELIRLVESNRIESNRMKLPFFLSRQIDRTYRGNVDLRVSKNQTVRRCKKAYTYVSSELLNHPMNHIFVICYILYTNETYIF